MLGLHPQTAEDLSSDLSLDEQEIIDSLNDFDFGDF